jgi:competence protein ComEC
VSANNYKFIGDTALLEEGMLQNFHLKPGRIALQLNKIQDSIDACLQNGQFYQFWGKKFLVIDKNLVFEPVQQKINVDVIIISKNPNLYITQLAAVFNCKQYVVDASNSLWKIERWKKDCSALHLQLFSVPEKGAFILDL